MMRTWTKLLGGVAAAVLVSAPAAAQEADASVDCGDAITTDVTLTRDLECTGNGLLLDHVDDPITIDLNGYAIRYVGTGGDHSGIYGGTAVTIVNGTIEGFPANDLDVYGYAHLEQVDAGRLRGGTIHVRSSTVGSVATVGTSSIQVFDSVVTGSLDAVQAFVRAHDSWIGGGVWTSGGVELIGNRIEGNVLLHDSSGSSQILDNRFHGGGIVLSGVLQDEPGQLTRVERNRFTNSSDSAIRELEHPTQANILIADNHITNAGRSGTGGGIELSDEGSTGVTITGNRIVKTAGHAIVAPSATDGGGNVARAAGEQPACLGVRCR